MNDLNNLIIWNKEDLPEKSGIYLFKNIVNNKIYIGQALNIRKRIFNHFNSSPELYFHRALRKYGEEGFNIYILEFIEGKENLNKQEIYYINKYNSNNPKLGYNLTEGGMGHLGIPLSETQKEKITEVLNKETWCFNYKTKSFYSENSRKKLSELLNNLGYEMNPQRITDAIGNKSYSGEFTFGNTKEEAFENSKNIHPKLEYAFYLYNYKTGELSDIITSLPKGEEYIRSKGYTISSGHLNTAIKNNNRYIKDFIFGFSLDEINKKINTYGIVTYCYNLNDNSLYRFTDSNEKICTKLEILYPEIHLCRNCVGKVKNNKQIQTCGFIFDNNIDNLIKRVSEYNSNCCEKIFTLAKEYHYLNSQAILNWQDKLNSISVDYSE